MLTNTFNFGHANSHLQPSNPILSCYPFLAVSNDFFSYEAVPITSSRSNLTPETLTPVINATSQTTGRQVPADVDPWLNQAS